MMHFWWNDAEWKHCVKHLNPQTCRANSDTSDLTYAPKNVTLFTFPKLSRGLLVYQEAASSPPDSFLQKKISMEFRSFSARGEDTGQKCEAVSARLRYFLNDSHMSAWYSGKERIFKQAGAKVSQLWKKGHQGSILLKKKSGQMCHCCFSSPYHLFALGIENCIEIKGWRGVNKHISV